MKELLGNAANFIEEEVEKDLASGRYQSIVTRFPPEPNGHLHIGHAKAITVDFNVAKKYQGTCNLRFDDTNPVTEDTVFIEGIQQDVRWLGFDWEDRLFYASDYFDKIYECAEQLIQSGDAYICDLTADELVEYRGTLTEPGKDSPYRDRSIEENLALFRDMKDGKFEEGEHTLRAKIDMQSPNMNMRDPVMYRIMYEHHHRTGDTWCIYPMYDFAHPISDGIEKITHSLCSLEFEDHRPLYEWFLEKLHWENPPRQLEFARLNITDTVMSKRLLLKLVEQGVVDSWDDPRMPTLSGLKRRGVTPDAIADFMERVGVAKVNSEVDARLLDHCIREDLKPKAHRRMAVVDPIELIITNYPEGQSETVTFANNTENPALGSRQMTFSNKAYIEREDFAIDPPAKYKRMVVGSDIRLMGTYIVHCTGYDADEDGNVTRVYCEYDPDTLSGTGSTKRPRGVIHYVDANNCHPAKFRHINQLYIEDEEGESIINPDSFEFKYGYIEDALASADLLEKFQFIRLGYYCKDQDTDDMITFNQTVSLKDSYKPNL